MSNRPGGARIVRFANVELDQLSGELSREGTRLLLAQQTFRLLLTLIREPGTVVSREELQRELWPDGTFVDFELGLNAAVKRLRETLGDSATAPRFIETIPRRGYRFIAAVEYPPESAPGVESRSVHELSVDDPLSADALPHQRWAWARRFPKPALHGTAILVLGGALIALAFGRGHPPELGNPVGPKITKITNLGTVRLASASPDGQHIAYVESDGVRESLYVRKIGVRRRHSWWSRFTAHSCISPRGATVSCTTRSSSQHGHRRRSTVYPSALERTSRFRRARR